MLDLGALKLSIKVDSQEANEELEKAKKSIGEVAGDLKNKLVSATKTAIAGLAGLATGAVALAESTREYRTEQAKLKTAFEDAGHTAEDAKTTYSELNSILGDSGQATEAANHLAKLCDTQEELSTWTTITTGVYATFGDSLPIESLTEASNETAKTGALTGALADALNWAGVSEDEFQSSLDKCNTEQERQALITETLNGLYDDAAEKYRTNAEDVIEANRANQRFQDTLATIAGVLEPVITKVKSFAADGLERIANIVVEHQDSIDKFVDAIASFGNFILDNSELIISGLVGIGTGLAVFNVASIVMKLVEGFKAMKAAEEGLTIAQAALNVVMNANPFILVASLVAGLVAAIITLWNTNENFRNAVIKIWNTIKTKTIEIVGGIVDAIVNFGTNFYNAGKEIFTSVWNGLKSVWDSICSWVSEKVNWLVDKLAFWRSGQAEMDGSHRTGLREVPYDGYIAELHKGEMVLTAYEAKQYQKQGSFASGGTQSNTNITVNNYSPKALNEAESARQFKKAQRELALGVA